jgi:hypothetical protein
MFLVSALMRGVHPGKYFKWETLRRVNIPLVIRSTAWPEK